MSIDNKNQAPESIDIDADGFTICPNCDACVNVGTGTIHNLRSHQKSTKCRAAIKKKEQDKKAETMRSQFGKFFKPRPTVPKVPPTVSQPEPVRSVPHLPSPSIPAPPSFLSTNVAFDDLVLIPTSIPCLAALRECILQLPSTIQIASADHPFAQFSGDLSGCVPDGEDAWEIWDGPLNTILQKDPNELQDLVSRGKNGLPALYRFLLYLANECRVDSVLFENKVDRVMCAIDSVISLNPTAVESLPGPSSRNITVEESDLVILDSPPSLSSTSKALSKKSNQQPCAGLLIPLPSGQTPGSAYPFLYHKSLGNPWDVIFSSGKLFLHARDCLGKSVSHDSKCVACASLLKNKALMGIMQRFEKGVDPNCSYQFHGPGGLVTILRRKNAQVRVLRVNRVNEATKLVRKSKVIDHYKEWVIAVASGKVEQVDRLVKVALANNRGIRGLLDLYHHAASDLYHPQSYSEEDKLRGILLWRLGGARVADIAHRSLALPSLRTWGAEGRCFAQQYKDQVVVSINSCWGASPWALQYDKATGRGTI